jgi:tripartite-type tricarboxylate transporter receptor subunit TctC
VLAPDIPTMAEGGGPGIDRIARFGAVLPKEIPDSIARTFNNWMQTILASVQTKRFFQTAGAEVFPGTREQLTALQRDEIDKWAKLVKLAKMEAQ